MLVDQGSGLAGFADWAEQLIAESTGKQGTGVLPVVVADDSAPEVALPPHDVTVARPGRRLGRRRRDADDDRRTGLGGSDVAVTGTARRADAAVGGRHRVAGRMLGINPFDQPDVESAKMPPASMLEGDARARTPPAFTDGAVEVRALGGAGSAAPTTVADAVAALLAQVDGRAGLRRRDGLPRPARARRRSPTCATPSPTGTGRPVTFGWGPRFLHSTGQYHKGGPAERRLPADHRPSPTRTSRPRPGRSRSDAHRRPGRR